MTICAPSARFPRAVSVWLGITAALFLLFARSASWASTRPNGDHPRLLFSLSDIPDLRSETSNGGNDAAAYSFVRLTAENTYPDMSLDDLLANDFALEPIPNLGLYAFVSEPMPDSSIALGKAITEHIASTWDVDDDCYSSSLRLRALALGYDFFYGDATDAERDTIRAEMESYIDYMSAGFNYRIWAYQPYLSNQTAMLAAALGLGAICLDGETDPGRVTAALAKADQLIALWLDHLVDDDGAYLEGALYGAWSLRNLVYYFHARKRYDGFDYALNPKIRVMERWFAYELDPTGGGRVNNIHDCTALDLPLARHTSYFDWAQASWGSELSRYIWCHAAGAFGFDFGDNADKVGTVLWSPDVLPASNPGDFLSHHRLWEKRGLYYYRTGWPDGATSNDVVFSFYSGEFQGGHAQEDQNQFTLTAFGEKFVIDHGPGSVAKQSEAHNMIFIDGKGQHNAGSSIGTDGQITDYVLSDYADWLAGDATAAYTTYSPLNSPGFPFPSSDWSWGYKGANPVDFASRSAVVVHDDEFSPYFIIVDDIQKDGTLHDYEWRLHTSEDHAVDVSGNPIRIVGANASLDMHVLSPEVGGLSATVDFFDNSSGDPNSDYISLGTTTARAQFALLLAPTPQGETAPQVSSGVTGGRVAATVWWGGNVTDRIVINEAPGEIEPPIPLATADGPSALGGDIETDAKVAVVRVRDGQVEKYLLSEVTQFWLNGLRYVNISDGPATVVLSGTRIDIDRPSTDFAFYAPGVHEVYYRGQMIFVVNVGGYVVPDPLTAIPDTPPLSSSIRVATYPNPFNPSATVAVDLEVAEALVDARIYDAAGREVRQLWSTAMPAGRTTMAWDGRDGRGVPVSSGVYVVRVRAGDTSLSHKLVLVR